MKLNAARNRSGVRDNDRAPRFLVALSIALGLLFMGAGYGATMRPEVEDAQVNIVNEVISPIGPDGVPRPAEPDHLDNPLLPSPKAMCDDGSSYPCSGMSSGAMHV